jgi:NADH:ubiquinone oxidoreductase subunit 3 (subunit A)
MIIFLKEYIHFFCYFLCSIIVATVMILVSRFFAFYRLESEKLSAYECGFEPFLSTRNRFDVTFSIIAILYLIFDLEIIILMPWVVAAPHLGILGYFSILFFLLLLMFGFVIEWFCGALTWYYDSI